MRIISSLLFLLLFPVNLLGQNWPSFRGHNASGVAENGKPPVVWDAEKPTNIAWKIPIPGFGHSSPVIWGDKVFVTTAISADPNPEFVSGQTQTSSAAKDDSIHEWRIYCIDRKSGRINWEKTAYKGPPRVKRHVKASFANSTPATDGRHVVAFFGSQGLYCYDLSGKLLWKKDLGVLEGGWSQAPGLQWGFGSSPIIYKHLVIIQCDTQKESFISAYNLSDGNLVWSTQRDEDTSWGTPVILEDKRRTEVITTGTKYFRGYDPLTGKVLWRLEDGVDVKIPTPVTSNGLIFLGGGSSHDRRTFYALRSGAKGEINPETSESIAWKSPLIKPHVVTPIIYGDQLYVCADNGVLTSFDIKTGEAVYRARLGKGTSFSASPVAADGRIYFPSEDGDVYVVRAGPNFELQATNRIGEVIIASPAISGDMIFIRGQHNLFAIK